jgi:hypothetical protein
MSGAFQPVPVGRRLARRRFFRPSLTQGTRALFRPGATDLTAMGPASIAARIVRRRDQIDLWPTGAALQTSAPLKGALQRIAGASLAHWGLQVDLG